MAEGKVCTGFSDPYVAIYNDSGGVITYTGGMRLARGVEVNIEPEVGDTDPFYADNVASETVPAKFTGGTITLTVDGLKEEAEKLIMGLPEPEELTYGEGKKANVYNYGEDMDPPYVGIGFLARYMSGGVESFAPVVLTKARFQTPNTNAATQEGQINWQTQELVADLARDDSTAKAWKKVVADVPTRVEGIEILKSILTITESQNTVEVQNG